MHSKNIRAKIIPTAGIEVLKDVGKEWFIDGNRTLNDYWMLLS